MVRRGLPGKKQVGSLIVTSARAAGFALRFVLRRSSSSARASAPSTSWARRSWASPRAPASIGGGLTGTLTIDGVSMAGRPVHELADRVAIGFQNPTTQRSGVTATVFEEIALGPMNLGCEVVETVERTRQAMAVLRIEDFAGAQELEGFPPDQDRP